MAPWLEEAWMQRYLHRELSNAEIDWFESYVVDKPHLVDALERDSDLRDVLALAGNDDWQGGRKIPAPARHAWRRYSWPSALAASLLVGTGIGMFAAMSSNQPVVQADPVRIFVDTMRGDTLESVVDHADSASDWVIIDVGVPAGARDISATHGSAPPVALRASADSVATVLLAREALETDPVVVLRYRLGDRNETKKIDLKGRLPQ
jgi:hypothetical protein